jgi:hypothetical protein
MNLIDPAVKSSLNLIVSTIWPHIRGSSTMQPLEISKLKLATRSIDLFLQVYPNNLLNVFPAFFAFLIYLSLLGSCSINEDRVCTS